MVLITLDNQPTIDQVEVVLTEDGLSCVVHARTTANVDGAPHFVNVRAYYPFDGTFDPTASTWTEALATEWNAAGYALP